MWKLALAAATIIGIAAKYCIDQKEDDLKEIEKGIESLKEDYSSNDDIKNDIKPQ
jgi:hypothetical protein